jgi:hypothetical protein
MAKLKITCSCEIDHTEILGASFSPKDAIESLLADDGYEAFNQLEGASQLAPSKYNFKVEVVEI